MDLIETLDMKYDPYLELNFPMPWSMVGNQVSNARVGVSHGLRMNGKQVLSPKKSSSIGFKF